MAWLNDMLVVIVGVLIRIVLPVLVTAVFILLLKRLDQRWQEEARQQHLQMTAGPRNIGCWDINKCSSEMQSKCKAYAHPESPCWQVLRDQNGSLQERCLGCQIFRKSPVPVAAGMD